MPSETRRRGAVTQAFTQKDVTYHKGEEVLASFRHWMLGSNVYKGLQVSDDFNVDVGLGMYVHMVSLDIDKDDGGGKYSTQDHWRLLPSVTVKGQYHFNDAFSALAKAQYQGWASDNFIVAEAGINYQMNPAWDVGLKYSYSETDLYSKTFKASYNSKNIVLTFSNRF